MSRSLILHEESTCRKSVSFAAFIGIDWADKKHDVCISVPGVDKRERSVIEHRPAALHAWADKLRERFGGAPVAVCLELSQGPIVSALLEHDFFVLFPVQPTTLARYRSAFTTSRAKDDPTDAEYALELLLRHPEKLSRLEPESVPMRSLRRLVEARRTLVDDRVRITNRITAALKAYFPQVLGWFRDKDAAVFADFVERWPTIQDAQRARKETLDAFFRSHNVRYPATIERRIEAIRVEQPLTTDPAVILPMRLLVESLLPQLRAASAAVNRFDDEIARLSSTLPDYELFRALPGAGPALAPRLLVAFGERRERFPDATALQKYAGVAPVTERSGNKSWIHCATHAPPSCAKPLSNGWARPSLAPSGLRLSIGAAGLVGCNIKQPSVRLPSSGSESSTAAGVDRQPYDEARYLMALQKRHAPLLKFAAETST